MRCAAGSLAACAVACVAALTPAGARAQAAEAHAAVAADGRAAPGAAIPVPRVAVRAGQTIDAALLIDRQVSASALDGRYATSAEQVQGRVARRVLPAGRAIALSAIKEADLVLPGRAVALVYRAPGLEISGRAMPLHPASAGQSVSIRNLDSGLVVQGVVQDDGSVQVLGE